MILGDHSSLSCGRHFAHNRFLLSLLMVEKINSHLIRPSPWKKTHPTQKWETAAVILREGERIFFLFSILWRCVNSPYRRSAFICSFKIIETFDPSNFEMMQAMCAERLLVL